MKKLIISIVLLATSVHVNGQIDRSKAPVPGSAPEINIPDPEVFELDNGMKVILSSNHKQPKVSFNLVMASDPRLEGEKAGLSEIAGDLILSGTEKRDKDQLDKEKDFIGATLAASSSSVYMSCLTKHMDKGLDLMIDVVKNANFPESEFDRIKKQYESALASASSDANTMAQNATSKVVFSDEHPRGEVMTPESLEKISRTDVIDFYQKQFSPAGSYLVIVGDIDIAAAKEIANKHFSDWEGTVPFEKQYGKGVFPSENKVYFVDKPGAVQSVITVAFPVDMKPGHPDQIKLSVLNKLLGGGGFGTRLMQNLREDKAFTYGAYSSLNVNRTGSLLSASGSFRNEVTDSAIVEFLYEFGRITEDFVTDEELELNKASMAGSFARSLESPRTIANFALNTFRNDLPSDYYQKYLKSLESVSKEDILEVAKKYITPENLNLIVVGNEEVVPKLEQFTNSEIIMLDAFGNPKQEIVYEPSKITKSEVIENYLMAVTQTNSMKKANKKIGKVKTMEQVVKMKPQQAPVELTMNSYFKAPYSRARKVEFNGMVVQKESFNGKSGKSETMKQGGGYDTEEFSEDEITDRKKTGGLFPELAMVCNGIEFDLLGITEVNDERFYVIEYTSGKTNTKAFYNVDDFMKKHTQTLTETAEGAEEGNATFSSFEAHNGILFPKKTVQMMGSAGFESNVEEVKMNGKIDDSKFE